MTPRFETVSPDVTAVAGGGRAAAFRAGRVGPGEIGLDPPVPGRPRDRRDFKSIQIEWYFVPCHAPKMGMDRTITKCDAEPH
jgi:hypothetical protein